MNKAFLKALLENLDDSCFPMQLNWNLEEMYIKGLDIALEKTLKDMGLKIIEK